MTSRTADATVAPALRRSLSRPSSVLAMRWGALVVTAAVTFKSTIDNVVIAVQQRLELVYLPAIVLYALFAAVATRRRDRPVVEIHDRETDYIVAWVLAAMAVIATTLLAPTLSGGYRMWRVDLLMLWVFAISAAALLFGLRRILQYRWAWLTLALIWPLPARLVTYVIGNGSLRWVAGRQLTMILVLLIIGRRPRERHWWLAPTVAAAVAAPALALDADRSPALIMVPPVIAIVIGGGIWTLRDRPRRRPTGPPAVKRSWVAVISLVVGAVIGNLVIPPLPPLSILPVLTPASTARGPGEIVPAGWRLLGQRSYPRQSAYFGVHADWLRYQVQAVDDTAGPQAVDSQGLHRIMMIDVLTTERPRTLDLFPLETTYPIGKLELTQPTPVDLGHRVRGSLYAAVDPRASLAWSMLTFSIEMPARAVVARPDPGAPAVLAQRITLLLVDDHRPGAPFPEPSRALLDSMRAVLSAILRGGRVAQIPEIKNADLLATAARQVLVQRIEGAR